MRIDYQNAILIVLCLILLLSVFSLSALAIEPEDVILVPVTTSDTLRTDGVSIGTANSINLYLGSSSAPVYAALYYQVRNGLTTVKCVSLSDTAQSLYFISMANDVGTVSFEAVTTSGGIEYQAETVVYPSALTTSYTIHANLSSALASIREYMANPPAPPASPFSYTLPPGNVAYIPIPRGQSEPITFTLTTTYYMAFGNSDTSRINQVVTVISSLPSSSNNVAPSSPKIPWTNNGNLNLLGVSANKIYQGSIPSNYGGQYLVVVNPMTMPSQSGLIGGDTYTNGSISISVSAVSGSPHIYPMSESLIITPGDGIGSESSYGDSGYTYEVDPETGEIIWTDPSGGNDAPVAGGNNPMPTPNTIFDWLRNISQQLSDFLRGPVQAVQVVVGAIRDFIGSFAQLYQWLPSPVYSLITSALMIALTIGVIKIFV